MAKANIFGTEFDIDEQIKLGQQEIESVRALGPGANSSLTWLPPLIAAGLPVPKTLFVYFEPEQLWPICDGNPAVGFPMEPVELACKEIGYPAFIRTDLSSAKHDGPASYRANSPDDLWRCVCGTFEDNALKDLASFTRAFMVREWLNLDSTFTAFGYSPEKIGHPIAREWRLFVNQEQVLCEHFYWPEDAVEDSAKDPEWRTKLRKMAETPENISDLRNMALRAAIVQRQGEWSVDFALDRAGKWWLIDMAAAESSWHPEHEGT